MGHLLSAKLECQEAGATPLAHFLSRKMATDMAPNKKHGQCSPAGDTDMVIATEVVLFVVTYMGYIIIQYFTQI